MAELNRKNAGIAKPELVARIALESGPAVLDASGEIYGDVANIAARVQALAEASAVSVTAQLQRQVAGLFVAEERGTHNLTMALFRLVRASGGGRRSGQRNLTPLVGRDDETAMLMRQWERARQGDGQFMMIVGEPGLDKSRLIEEFHIRLRDTPHIWVEWASSQLLQNTPLHPISEWGRQRFGGADVPAERRLADLESSLQQVGIDPRENAPLLAPLVDVPLPPERELPGVAPEEFRRRQLAALNNWVLAEARVQPVVLAFEDLHWAEFDHNRCFERRRRARRARTAPRPRHHTDRVQAALGCALASRHNLARAARPTSSAAYGRRDRYSACSAAGRDRWRHRAYGRGPAVRRGGDAPSLGTRRSRGWHPGDSARLARSGPGFRPCIDGAKSNKRPATAAPTT